MDILPSKKAFDRLVTLSPRVPVCGQEKIRNLELSKLYQKLFLNTENTFLFESGNGPDETARFSLMGKTGSRILEIRGSHSRLFHKGAVVSEWDHPDPILRLLNFEENAGLVDYLPHFWGGWVGFIGYEAGAWFELLPQKIMVAGNLPDLLFMEVDSFYLYDHLSGILKYILFLKSFEILGFSYLLIIFSTSSDKSKVSVFSLAPELAN